MSIPPRIASQITITLPNQPGSLARLCDALRGAQINIEALSCAEENGTSRMHIIVDEHEKAALELQSLGPVRTDEVLAFVRPDRQGEIFEIARTCAGNNINIKNSYATTHGESNQAMIYMHVDKIEEAKELFLNGN